MKTKLFGFNIIQCNDVVGCYKPKMEKGVFLCVCVCVYCAGLLLIYH